jgi:hypothetical protein
MISNQIFAVCAEPYCVWGWDLEEENSQFISEIDGSYFEYICETHLSALDGDNAQRAAVALRINYHLSLETLFGLIGAMLQSPRYVPGWILKATTNQIREITSSLERGVMTFPTKLDPRPPYLDFETVVRLIFQHTPWPDDEDGKIFEGFVGLLHRLAHDFLDQANTQEYNSIKHGFRARAGGFSLAVGVQKEKGVPAAPEEMKSMGGSKFGTSFFVAEIIGEANRKRDPHFRLRRRSLNWLPDMTAEKMLLAATMIKNLKSILTLVSEPSSQAEFARPNDLDAFEAPWRKSVGIRNFDMARVISEAHISRATREELKGKLENREC